MPPPRKRRAPTQLTVPAAVIAAPATAAAVVVVASTSASWAQAKARNPGPEPPIIAIGRGQLNSSGFKLDQSFPPFSVTPSFTGEMAIFEEQ